MNGDEPVGVAGECGGFAMIYGTRYSLGLTDPWSTSSNRFKASTFSRAESRQKPGSTRHWNGCLVDGCEEASDRAEGKGGGVGQQGRELAGRKCEQRNGSDGNMNSIPRNRERKANATRHLH